MAVSGRRRFELHGASIRALLSAGTIFVGTMGAAICFCLVLLSAILHARVEDLIASLRSVLLANKAEVSLLLYHEAHDPVMRAVALVDLRAAAHQAIRYVQSAEEAKIVEDLNRDLDRYELQGPDSTERERTFVDALSSTRRLTQINLEQAYAAERRGTRFDSFARTLGLVAAALLGLGIIVALWWLRYFVFRPILRVDDALRRFSAGNLDVRAEASGADELRRLAHLFNRMAHSLGVARLNQLRYLAGVVDELRNPLTALQLATEYVTPAQPLPSEERLRELFALIHHQILLMNSMVGDVLNAAAVEAGAIKLSLSRCDARELSQQCVELFRRLAPQHQINLELPSDPVLLTCDRVRVGQVLNNLLSNAIKFSCSGTPVEVRLSRLGDSEVAISVIDQGTGIPPEEREKIFEPFQPPDGMHQEAPGVGLGLYVSRRMIEAHGGRLELTSSVGHGSTFTVILPTQPKPFLPSELKTASALTAQ